MDTSSSWLSELDMQDQGFVNDQLQMIRPYYLVADFSVDSSPSESNTKNSSTFVDQAFQALSMIKETNDIKSLHSYKSFNDITNKHTQNDENPKPLPNTSKTPNTFTISFGEQKPKDDQVILLGDSLAYTTGIKKGTTTIRNRIQLQEHMLSERKRREKLARRFLSLSALLPGRKKMDKAAVLEDAFDYIRELQGRVNELEGLTDTKTNNIPPTASEKRLKLSHSNNEDGNWSSDKKNFGEIHSAHCNPEIEVKMSGSSVLVRIYSQKKYVSLIEVVKEMEKLGLSITSSITFPFASTTFLITIIAKKKNDFFMTSSDLVKNLQLAI